MEYSEVVRRRRMVRHFSGRPIPEESVERILRSALRAPSGGFSQGWAFLALEDYGDRKKFWDCLPNAVSHAPELQPAPLIVVPLAHEKSYLDRYSLPDKMEDNPSGPGFSVPYWYIDTGMASLLMLLTAVDEYLDACFFTIVTPEIPGFLEQFDIPTEYEPIGAIAVGYRAADLPPQVGRIKERRLGVDKLVHRGTWGIHRPEKP
ncbi:nitroreductase family protein [Streptomyces sp. NEAU-YJ-81]|uniref:nitroreductase family protein n=1 Tax=Streptomyces sp. NEAU-YJ-81 TaxID=2820288 RepID=UPI001ABCC73E|nr:nitroreductase family protein [Streptomyces sp. NEAU-YJ-81]MBO3681366.1 nitroreductase family protein [Streptomyces sp. NEAU-YJ-81]